MKSVNDTQFVETYLADLVGLLPQLDSAKIGRAIAWLRKARDADKTTYICGNGGSAAIASQMVVDIVKGASLRKKKRFKMIGLTDNMGTVTAYANDEGYESVFVEPLKNFAERGDILIGLSGSGNSPNVLKAFTYAKSAGVKTIGITSGQQGLLRQRADLGLTIPSPHMGRLEDSFFIITHILCYAFIEAP
jgi:D-sedoheptulose 7-phosphate isomerase